MTFIVKTIFTVVLAVHFSFGQNYTDAYKENWTKREIYLANTAKYYQKLDDTEKEVILLCNLARMNGKKFVKTIVTPYVTNNEVKKNKYLTSLIQDLNKQKKMNPLKPDAGLIRVAKSHAMNMGKKGKIGHMGYSNRIRSVEVEFNRMAENCDYGNQEPIDIVMSLLIDEDVPSLGHRQNILNPEFTHIGVGEAYHSEYDTNFVQEFGEKINYTYQE